MDVERGLYVALCARVANPTVELMANVTTGVIPVSKRTFHCVAKVEGEALRRAGSVTMVVLIFVPE